MRESLEEVDGRGERGESEQRERFWGIGKKANRIAAMKEKYGNFEDDERWKQQRIIDANREDAIKPLDEKALDELRPGSEFRKTLDGMRNEDGSWKTAKQWKEEAKAAKRQGKETREEAKKRRQEERRWMKSEREWIRYHEKYGGGGEQPEVVVEEGEDESGENVAGERLVEQGEGQEQGQEPVVTTVVGEGFDGETAITEEEDWLDGEDEKDEEFDGTWKHLWDPDKYDEKSEQRFWEYLNDTRVSEEERQERFRKALWKGIKRVALPLILAFGIGVGANGVRENLGKTPVGVETEAEGEDEREDEEDGEKEEKGAEQKEQDLQEAESLVVLDYDGYGSGAGEGNWEIGEVEKDNPFKGDEFVPVEQVSSDYADVWGGIDLANSALELGKQLESEEEAEKLEKGE